MRVKTSEITKMRVKNIDWKRMLPPDLLLSSKSKTCKINWGQSLKCFKFLSKTCLKQVLKTLEQECVKKKNYSR